MSMHLYVDNNRLKQDFTGKMKAWPSIELGLATELVVDLQTGGQSVIYHECLARLLLAEVFILKGYEFIKPFEQQGGVLDYLFAEAVEEEEKAIQAASEPLPCRYSMVSHTGFEAVMCRARRNGLILHKQ